MPDQLTGYDPTSGNASGKGGRARETSVMSQVDAAQSGVKAATAPTSQSAPSQGLKTHPAASSIAPSENSSAVVSHVYGSPIEGNGPSK